jgi:hypothetical protein
MRRIFFVQALVVLWFTPAAIGDTIIIPDDYPTIQQGIGAALVGDTVLVAAATYYEHLDFLGKSILVKSIEGAQATVLESYYQGTPIVSFVNGEGSASILDGFTIQNSIDAPAMYISGSSPTIVNNSFIDNINYGEGGGISAKNLSFPSVINNIFMGNRAIRGAGVDSGELTQSDIMLSGNVFIDNYSETHGGGAFIRQSHMSVVDHNLFYQNHCLADGGAMDISQCSNIDIHNNTVAFNTNDETWQAGGISLWISEYCRVYNNIIVNNTGTGLRQDPYETCVADHNDVWSNELDYDGINPGEGSISADPLFVGGEPFSFELTDDSPCIDAGDPDSPLDPDGTIADMGAYYFSQLTTGFGLDIADAYGENGQPAEIPVFAYGLQDQMIAGVEFHIAYDDVCLEFADVSSDYLTDPLINVADGVIHLLWEDYQDPVTVPDSASIIEMDFTVLGGLGDSCLVQWTGNNEIVDPEGEVIADLDWLDGSVFVVEFHDISGNIVYYDLTTPVPDVTIDLAGDFDGTTVSDGNGAYIFEDIIPGDFTVCPSRGDDDVGVTVTDIVLIRRHIVWLEIFDSPYKLVAADVNNSGGVTVADVIKMRRYLADLEELPGGNWAFVDSSFAIDDGNWADAPGCLEATLWDMDLTDSSFVGIRMGDVDFSWAQGRRGIVPPKVTDTAVLDLADCYGLPGDTIYMPINVAGFDGVAGLEMHIEYPEDGMRFVEIGSDVVDDPTTNGQDGAIHFIWEDIFNVVHLGDGDEVAHVAFEILEGAEDSMLVSFTAAYVVDEEGLDFAVESSDGYVLQQQTPYDEGGNVIPRFYRLGQNYPNPFNARTMIDFDLPRSSQVTIEIYDMLGRRAEILANDFLEAGYHQIIWDAADQPSGIYFYRIKAADFADCKKMLLLK